MKKTRKHKRLLEKNYRAFKELLKIIKHYFPNFNQLLSSAKDPRHSSYITGTTSRKSINIEIGFLKAALDETSKKRGSTEVLKNYRNIIDVVRNSDVMIKQRKTYQKDFEYASDISFDEVCDAVVQMMDSIYE